MPQPGNPRYPGLLKEMEALFARCQTDGYVRVEYDCVISYGSFSERTDPSS